MDSSDNSSVCSNLSDCNYDDSNSESDISIVNNENFSCGYVGEQLKSRTFSSDSENENNDRGGWRLEFKQTGKVVLM